MAHPEDFKEEQRRYRKAEYTIEDSYIKNYDKKVKDKHSLKKAYCLKGRKISLGAISAIHEIIDLDILKKETKKQECTVTQYLTAVLVYCIYKANFQKNNKKNAILKKPIKICVPVNLKRYFSSKTINNFFSYITVEANTKELIKNKELDFDKILTIVKEEFKEKLTEKEIQKTMSSNVKLGINPFIKTIPLILKKPIVRISYKEIRKYTTMTFSNIGRIGIIGKYQKYIEHFLMLMSPDPVEKIKCSACSFENEIVFTFTSILNNCNIEKEFYEFLTKKGIKSSIESNGVLDVVSTKIK